MNKKIIAQTRPLVQFETLSIQRERQLRQLSRLAPDLFNQVIEAIRRFPKLDYNKRIAGAMKQVLAGHTKSCRTLQADETRSILVNVTQPDGCTTEVLQVPGTDQPLYDLLIASKKYGYGSTTNADAPIIWWKVAGHEKQAPRRSLSIVDPALQQRLEAYELVDTEVQPSQVIRKYRKLEVA